MQERNLLERTLVKENGLNFSIEMETSTGKTYVYLRTILELAIKYGWKKFIIVVPSIAIRAGTMKSLSITHEHFRNLYNAIPYEYFEYASSNLSRVRSFAASNTIQIMVINIQSFRRESNIINTESDKMDGAAPMEFISSARPVVIIDEPQSVDSTEGARAAIQSLNPLFTLRYSATHRDIDNLMYRYDPVRAFQENRVKQICVISTTAEGASNTPYIQAALIDNKKGIKARIRIQVDSDGSIGEKSINLKGGQVYDLFELSSQKDGYQGWIIPADGIWAEPGNESLKFTNGTELRLHEEIGGMTDEIQRIQIHATVQRHLEQELILQPRGIKVLSLFFVDKVANYRYWEEGSNEAVPGKFAQWFEEAYEELCKQPCYAKLALPPVKEAHNGYFAEDNKHHYTDTGGENLKLDTVAYELIMEKKEELLDPAVPLRFIFSHSALREGWDNPNVFQICALRDMATVRQRRQTIGRGLRIAVNSEGERVFDKGLNKLYVIANESYAQFAKGLQEEYETDANVSFGKIPPMAFARLLVITPAGTEQPLGRNGSEAVWQNLSEKGLVDSAGKLTDKFQPGKPDFSLQLPKEYAQIESDILTVLQSYQIGQHITKGDPRQVILRREVITENQDFRALWERIKQKTTYEVQFSSEDLIREAAKSIRTASAFTAATVFVDVAALQVCMVN